MLSRIKTRCVQVATKLTKSSWQENNINKDVYSHSTYFGCKFGVGEVHVYIDVFLNDYLTYNDTVE